MFRTFRRGGGFTSPLPPSAGHPCRPGAKNESFNLKPRSPNRLSAQALRKPCTPPQVPPGALCAALGSLGLGFEVLPPHAGLRRFRSKLSCLASNPRSPAPKPPDRPWGAEGAPRQREALPPKAARSAAPSDRPKTLSAEGAIGGAYPSRMKYDPAKTRMPSCTARKN